MNHKNNHQDSKNIFAYSISFLLLSITLVSFMIGYWWMILVPRLIEEANTHAQVVAHSQTNGLERIITNNNSSLIEKNLNEELDHIILITEPTTKVRLFESVAIKLDHDVVQSLSENLYLSRGKNHCLNCIEVDTALYSSTNDELMGIIKFVLNEEIFLKLKNDLQKKLFVEVIIVLVLLLFAWFITVKLIVRLNKQEQKRIHIEDTLRKNEKKYYRLVNNLNNYFTYRKDIEGNILHISDSVEQVIGYSVDDIMLNFSKYCHSTKAVKISNQNSQSNDKQSSYEIEIEAKDGSIHNIELSEIPIHDDNDQLIEYEGIAHDITEQKKHEEQLSISKEQAVVANKIKSQFLANMSHEIRTPLNGIIGLGQILLKDKLTDKQRSQIERINTSSNLLLNLVNEILDFSKVESGKLELDKINFSIRDVIKNIYELLLEKSTLKHLQLNTFIDPRIPDVMIGDPLRLSQILINLTNNAIKFTDQGAINIHAQLNREDELTYTLLFSVKDTGIGISSDDINKLFKEFSQVDNSMSRKFGGTGLGLAICKKLTHLMHGDIWLESQPNIGSTFYFTIQLQRIPVNYRSESVNINIQGSPDKLSDKAADSIENVLPTDTKAVPSQSPVPKILLAEDNEINQEVALSLLEEVNAEVIVANNGYEAVQKAREDFFSLILMDLQMPEMDGFKAMEQIRVIPAYRNTPIIAMTAHAMSGDKEKCLEKGMDDYLAKPIDIEIFFTTVTKWLNKSKDIRKPEIKGKHTNQQTIDLIRHIPDIDHEQAIKRFKGDYELIKNLLTHFVESKANVVREIKSHLDNNEISSAQELIHNLKGIAGNISAVAIENNTIALEQALENNEQALADDLLMDIQSQIDKLTATVRQLA